MKKIMILLLITFLVSFYSLGQNKKEKDIHKTILEFDFTFNLYQQAKSRQNSNVDMINVPNNFFGFRYVNSFFVRKDLAIGFGIGLEMAPVKEFPVVLDIRKYFNERKSYVVFNIGKAYNGFNEFKTLLGEVGFGKSFKLGKKNFFNLSANYQLTYLKEGRVETNVESRWVTDFYTHTIAFKIALGL